MDPLTALSISTAVVQFLDFGSKILSKSFEIYNSGTGAQLETQHIAAIATNMLELVNQLEQKEAEIKQQTSAPWTPEEARRRRHMSSQTKQEEAVRDQRRKELLSIVTGCKNSAIDLLNTVERLKIQGTITKWKVFRQALYTVWKEEQVEAMVVRLGRYREQLNTVLLTSIKEKLEMTEAVYASIFEQREDIQSTEARTQAILSAINNQFSNMEHWKADIILAICNSQFQSQSRMSTSGQVQLLSSTLSKSAKSQRARVYEQRLIQRLAFNEMSERKSRISQAHQKTFEWAYAPPDANQPRWSSFVDFLEGDTKLYWITGKPGSGKSTLMRYLYDNPRTLQHISRWSGGSPVIMAGFFFWNSGTAMQMSNLGLLQTLLYECLCQRPRLVPKVFKARWERCELFGDDPRPWDWEELLEAFLTFCNLQSLSGNMFLFFDGMDEYGGRHQDLVSLIQQLERLPKIKICASSRPWLVFEDAFKVGASLMLQDLTFSDILRFVNDKLASNDRFAQLRNREAQFASTLEIDIANKSHGVFLWVHLVVESLLDGLRNSDRVSDLKKRLETIPPDLDGFYNSILNGSDNFYFEHAAQLIRILRKAEGSINLMDFAFADEEDPGMALDAAVHALSHEERVYRCEAIRRRINSRTKGLLDIPLLEVPAAGQPQLQVTPTTDSKEGQRPSRRGERGALDPYQDYSTIELTWLKVEYLHRTVKDFLDKPDIWSRLVSGSPPPFDPSLALARSCILRLKDYSPDQISGVEYNMWSVAQRCNSYLKDARISTADDHIPLLRELQNLAQVLEIVPRPENALEPGHPVRIVQHHESGHSTINAMDPKLLRTTVAGGTLTEFLSLDEQAQLYIFIRRQVEQGALQPQDQQGRPFLSYALLNFEPFSILRLRLLHLLLYSGADPNQAYHSQGATVNSYKSDYTPWRDLIAQIEFEGDRQSQNHYMHVEEWVAIADLFMQYKVSLAGVPFIDGSFFERVLLNWDSTQGRRMDERLKQCGYDVPVSSKKRIKARVSRFLAKHHTKPSS
ncbi:P-loop containing protein [Fusarium heterosporum]|uniref:P-loop containing protein n=1 Tax=Fusarium heterosporum TaxID=42747 RepID=A0A8H5TLX8_FUSHE|nr:P-loop containing protein [Fusarium heterosporum]